MIPITDLANLAKRNKLKLAVLWAHDGELQHIVTWGDTIENCDSASQGGEKLKELCKWENYKEVFPSRVKKLMEENKKLKARIALLEAK